MLAVSWFGTWQTRAGRNPHVWLLRVLVAMTFAGWVALLAGWYVTEIGRQPWLVHGLLLAADAASAVPAPNIALTLTFYLVLYAFLLLAYVSVVFHLASSAAAKHFAPLIAPDSGANNVVPTGARGQNHA